MSKKAQGKAEKQRSRNAKGRKVDEQRSRKAKKQGKAEKQGNIHSKQLFQNVQKISLHSNRSNICLV